MAQELTYLNLHGLEDYPPDLSHRVYSAWVEGEHIFDIAEREKIFPIDCREIIRREREGNVDYD